MAGISIRRLDPRTKSRLKVRAARRQRSMEEEARQILKSTLEDWRAARTDLASAIARRFQPLGGVALRLEARELVREPPIPRRR